MPHTSHILDQCTEWFPYPVWQTQKNSTPIYLIQYKMRVQIRFCATNRIVTVFCHLQTKDMQVSQVPRRITMILTQTGNIHMVFFIKVMRFLAQPLWTTFCYSIYLKKKVVHKGCAKKFIIAISTFSIFHPGSLEDTWLLSRKGFSPIWVFYQIFRCLKRKI